MKSILPTIFALFGTVSLAPAATVSLLNVDVGTGAVKTDGAVLGEAGDIWNAPASSGPGGNQLVATTALNWADGSGSSGISFAISQGFHAAANANANSDALLKDYLYFHTTSAQQSVTITLSGFVANQTIQSVVLYGIGDVVGQNSTFTIAGFASESTSATAAVNAADFVNEGQQFVRFDNVQADINGDLKVTWANAAGSSGANAWAGFNGMQVSVPEPSAALLGGLGLLALLRRRR